MSKYRKQLPQLSGGLFLTDGGIETTLIFQEGLELPYFAAFHLLREKAGREALVRYYERYIAIAKAEAWASSWRARPGVQAPTGATSSATRATNGRGQPRLDAAHAGPAREVTDATRADGGQRLRRPARRRLRSRPGDERREAETYHRRRSARFAEAGADMVTAITMTNANEADRRRKRGSEGRRSRRHLLHARDRWPSADRPSLADAIGEVDAATAAAPAYYMINCAHPPHFHDTLRTAQSWAKRIRGIRANASRRSHQELNEAPDLDAGDPLELGGQYRDLVRQHPQINVLGGCCGTDHRHVECISLACRTAA